jgi:hypothetical protein
MEASRNPAETDVRMPISRLGGDFRISLSFVFHSCFSFVLLRVNRIYWFK